MIVISPDCSMVLPTASDAAGWNPVEIPHPSNHYKPSPRPPRGRTCLLSLFTDSDLPSYTHNHCLCVCVHVTHFDCLLSIIVIWFFSVSTHKQINFFCLFFLGQPNSMFVDLWAYLFWAINLKALLNHFVKDKGKNYVYSSNSFVLFCCVVFTSLNAVGG